MVATNDNEAVFRAVIATFGRGDIDGAASYFAEDGTVVDYSDPTVVHSGRAAIAAFMRSLLDAIPDIEVDVVDLVESGGRLAAEVVGRGTPRGRTRSIELHYFVFDVVRNGEIVSEHLYVDSGQMPAME